MKTNSHIIVDEHNHSYVLNLPSATELISFMMGSPYTKASNYRLSLASDRTKCILLQVRTNAFFCLCKPTNSVHVDFARDLKVLLKDDFEGFKFNYSLALSNDLVNGTIPIVGSHNNEYVIIMPKYAKTDELYWSMQSAIYKILLKEQYDLKYEDIKTYVFYFNELKSTKVSLIFLNTVEKLINLWHYGWCDCKSSINPSFHKSEINKLVEKIKTKALQIISLEFENPGSPEITSLQEQIRILEDSLNQYFK
jgi:hypothetical protein